MDCLISSRANLLRLRSYEEAHLFHSLHRRAELVPVTIAVTRHERFECRRVSAKYISKERVCSRGETEGQIALPGSTFGNTEADNRTGMLSGLPRCASTDEIHPRLAAKIYFPFNESLHTSFLLPARKSIGTWTLRLQTLGMKRMELLARTLQMLSRPSVRVTMIMANISRVSGWG